jgi:hypothetical protein
MNDFGRAFLLPLLLTVLPAGAAELSFNRDIRPILSDNCYSCHGPDKHARKGDRRLDTADGATVEHDGVQAIVPGDLTKSELVARIESHDPDDVMPPPKSEKKLSPAQMGLLKQWIEQGAKYEPHWSFIAPQRPAVPEVGGQKKANPIDAFILARLEKEALKPAPEAERTALIRRATYDVTGLPPTPAEIDLFLADPAPDAYERLIDRLLASPRYGEKLAVQWLDLSRYADTHGYHLDAGREMWKWREWVIAAFNRNLRYDEFTLWQLAGDLLPNATIEQKLATGFVRNGMINFEGGAIADEYLAAYVKDRTSMVGTVFLGLTVGCAECHDHKFDPITQREYYQLFAYFNAVPEKGLDGSKGNAAPLLEFPTPEQQTRLAALPKEIAAAEKKLTDAQSAQTASQTAWEPTAATAEAPLPGPEAAILALPVSERTPSQGEQLRKFYREKVAPLPKELTAEPERLRKELEAEKSQVPTVMVMEQMATPRETHLLNRGQYDQPGEVVTPGAPASLPPLPADAPANRLGLARWLVDPRHPLTARVTVNRFWQLFMGTGIVKTLNDFGSQGEWPSHPELLDWLATEFTESGWDVKHLVKLIVTSETYRQSAKLTPELKERDPYNRLYARGPRFRLSAEEIRDTALAVSGLLSPKIGGPSVSPYQPEGLWEELSSRGDSKKWTAQFYVQSHGEDLYRRSLYTFWKRTCPPPQLQSFDAPDREICTVSRERTNTPLQSLVLLNDPTYVEASRTLAERMMTEAGATPAERVRFAFRLATARGATDAEVTLLVNLFEQQRSRYAAQREEALKLLTNGEHPRNETLDPVELAAWTNVASTILNLDETVTKS